MGGLKRLAVGIGLVLLFAILASATFVVLREFAGVSDEDDSWVDPTPATDPAPKTLREFYTQKLSWFDCEEGRCARVTVPIDYAKPDGPTLELHVAVVPATGKGGRSLFVNPGGPGEPAAGFALTMAKELPRDVRRTYDIVGIDPRGVGESTPVRCFSDDEFDDYIATDPTPDTAEEIRAFETGGKEMADGCTAMSGDLAAHVSTAEAARDFDVVRHLLGHSTLDYFGASYGTALGATYATLFPERVGRMVLDGAVDPEQDAFAGSMAQTIGFQRALNGYLDFCVDKGNCPLGSTRAAAEKRLIDLMASIDEKPLRTGDPDRKLTEAHAFIGTVVPLYSRDSWSLLTPALKDALEGDGDLLMQYADFYYSRNSDGSFKNNSQQVFAAVNCLDEDDNPTPAEVRSRLDEFTKASPLFGQALGWGPIFCSGWPDSKTPMVDIDGKGAPPILVLGTTRDPATPYESAVALSKQLASGVLVTRDGDGHTAYVGGPDCIRNVVDSFFLTGTVPKEDPRC